MPASAFTNIAFLGTGNMGAPMARNLLRAGYKVTVWNRTRALAEPLAADGARVADSVADAVGGADAAFTMLADDRAIRDILHVGLLRNLAPGAVHIGSSTISVELARELAYVHDAAGQGYISAPVLGRPEAAEAAKLLLMAAGPADRIEQCRPLFDAIGRATSVVGPEPWQANLVKIAVNFMIVSVIETFGEAFALVRKAKVPSQQFLEIANDLFQSPVYRNYGGIIANKNYEPAGFRMRLGLKDTNLALAAASAQSVPMPLASLIHDHYMQALAQGWSDRDWSALAEVSASNAGLL